MEPTQMKPDPEQASSMGPVEDPPPEDNNLEISIKMQDQTEVKFRVKGHTPFQKVFNAWARKKGVQMQLYRFLDADGERINPEDTPNGRNIENGHIIDAMISQEGGRLWFC